MNDKPVTLMHAPEGANLNLWPQYDPAVMQEFGGRWVVVVDREIIAVDKDPKLAREKAKIEVDRRGLVVPHGRIVAIALCKPDSIRI